MPNNPEIFISYAWDIESEEIVNEIITDLREKDITFKRDKNELEYKDNIVEFMKRLGKGKYIILIISEKYLKSENCMFELVEISKNGNFYKRIFPIILKSANIFTPEGRLRYIQYWDLKLETLDAELKNTTKLVNVSSIYEALNLYSRIRRSIDQLINILRQMNAPTLETHRIEHFKSFFEAIEKKMQEDNRIESGQSGLSSLAKFKIKRIESLQERLKKQYDLLAQYEEKMDTSHDPKEKLRCKREINNIETTITSINKEIDELELGKIS